MKNATKTMPEIPILDEANEAIDNYVENAYSEDLIEAGKRIAARSCVLEIHFGRIGFTKRINSDLFMDKVAKDGVDVSSAYLKISQDILNKSEVRDLDNHLKRFKKYLKSLALPGGMLTLGGGQYLVPIDRLEDVYEEINSFIVQRNVYLDAFETKYPDLIEEAKDRRGQFFNANDYPSFSVIRQRYTIDYKFTSNQLPEEYNKLNEDIKAELVRKYSQDCASAAKEARDALRQSLQFLLRDMLDMLSDDTGKKRRFSKNKVSKFVKFINGFSTLDITNDKEIRAITDTCKTILSNSGDVAENCKNSDSFKQEFSATFKAVSSELSKIIEGNESRLFDFS